MGQVVLCKTPLIDEHQTKQVVQVVTPQKRLLNPYCQIFKTFIVLSGALKALV
jgi:hypothetical protein